MLGYNNKLLAYVSSLLEEHFEPEEKTLFDQILAKEPSKSKIIQRLITDHQEIREKEAQLRANLNEFSKASNEEIKTKLLFPAYNLIGTLSHHGMREDRELFTT